MDNCINCKNKIALGNVLTCPDCGKVFCIDCAKNTKNICPYCYQSLEFFG